MADGTLIFDTKIDTSNYEKGLNNMKRNADNSSQEFDQGIEGNKKSLLSLSNVAKLVGSYLSVNLFKEAITTGVQYNAQIEQYQVALTTLTGSAQEAQAIMEQIKIDASKTPFGVEELTKANQLLISTGLSASTSRDTILALGNAISATGGGNEELSRMAVNLQQIQNAGKATALDIRQFAYAGIDLYGLLADYLGVTKEEASEMDVTFEQLSGALISASQEGGKYYNAMEEQSKTLNGQLSNLSDNVKNYLGNSFMFVNDILKNDLLPSLNSFLSGDISFSEFASNLANTFVNVASQIGGFADSLIQSGLDLAVKLSEGFVQGIPQFLSGVLDFLGQAGAYLTANVPIWIQKGFEILSNLVQGIINALPEMISRLPQIITTFANIINENFPTILAKGAELLLQLVGGIIGAIPTLIANIPQIIEAIVSVFTAFNWLNLGSQIITFLGDGIAAMVGFAQSCAQSIGQAIVNFLQNLPSQVISIGSNIVSFFGNAISGGIGYVTSAVSSIASSIMSGFASLPRRVISVGSNIVRGIWNGITGMGGWLMDQIKGFANGIVGGIKDFFGIKSPSRVMRDEVGKFLAQGISVGFEKEMPKSIKDIDNSLAKANMDMSARLAQLAYRGSQIMNPYYNNSITNNSTMNFYTKTVTADELQRTQRLSARYGLAGAR